MAVSKRLRYEILRRDNFTCRYCMTATPGTPLRVDHVVPVALGGTDDPTNLVTSCEPCNGGKSSTVPDSPLVAQVKEDAMRWQMAWAVAVAEAESEGRRRAKDIAKVKKNYTAAYRGRHGTAPILPEGWEASVGRWLDLGLPLTLIDKAIASAVGRDKIPANGRFAYFAGCCWSLLRELKDRTEQIAKQATTTPTTGADECCEHCDGDHDDRDIDEYVTDVFKDAWSISEPPNSFCLRMLAAYARAASGAGYDKLSIGYAAHMSARQGHADLGSHLLTLNDVLERAAEPDWGSPYGRRIIDADLLPTDDDRSVAAVAEAAVCLWRTAWRDAGGEPPSRLSQACIDFRARAADIHRENEDAVGLLRGAERAGSEGSSDLSSAIKAAWAFEATEPAVSAWHAAWCEATGSRPTHEQHDELWKDCYALLANGTWEHHIFLAAAFAGVHATTRMHFGLADDKAETIGVDPGAQQVEDAWARTWNECHFTWPAESDRADFRAGLSAIRDAGAHLRADVGSAAIAAGVYGTSDLQPFLQRSLSVFNAAADLPQVGGE